MEQAILEQRPRGPLLPALVGAGVPSLTGRGKVVSAFSGAVNIRHSQGLLISFVEHPRAMTYLSICVPSFFQNQERGLATGDRVLFEGRRLVIKDVVVDLSGRPLWQGAMTRNDVKELSALKVTLLKEALLLTGKEGGFLGLLRRDEAVNPFVRKAREVLSRPRETALRANGPKALSGLVGLGPGSTPSGDDFITGVLMGEEAKAFAETGEPMIPWSSQKEDVRLAMDKTNDAGKTLLWQALQGRFPNYLIETVRSVSEAKGKQQVEDAVERAVSPGATSGTDALVGFVYGFETHEEARHQ